MNASGKSPRPAEVSRRAVGAEAKCLAFPAATFYSTLTGVPFSLLAKGNVKLVFSVARAKPKSIMA